MQKFEEMKRGQRALYRHQEPLDRLQITWLATLRQVSAARLAIKTIGALSAASGSQLSFGYRGKMREGSCRKRLRYAAISRATLMKSFTLSRRISLMICFRPARYLSASSGVLPSRRDPIWMRTLSSVHVNTLYVSTRTAQMQGIQQWHRKKTMDGNKGANEMKHGFDQHRRKLNVWMCWMT